MENKFIQNIENRSIKITKVSIIGIITNIILAIVKIVLGTMTGSVAIISDAINNITDSSSSIITIIGTKLSEKAPDKEHPFGHGRTEYLTSLVIGTIILITGFQMFISSVENLGKKAEYNYSLTVIIIMILSIVSKIFLGIYTENKGKKLGSEALVGSGKDAKNDAFVTTFALISALFYIFTKISIDAIASAFIALFVIKAGYDLLKETINKIAANQKKIINISHIQEIVCDYFGIRKEQLLSKTRKREIALPRQLAMYFSKEYTSATYARIGHEMGGKDHSTVMHAHKTIKDYSEMDKDVKKYIKELKEKIFA